MSKKSLKILLVDDHSLIRDGIKSAISASNSRHKIHEADSVEAANSEIKKTKPDVIVLDISLPDGNGMDLAEDIKSGNDTVKIIMLSMYDDYDYISRCLEIGVDGYVLKNEGEEVVPAIEEAMMSKKYYSSGVKDLIINQYTKKIQNKNTDEVKINLTNREKEVMKFVVDGLTSKEIADELYISTRTVDTHRSNIMKKLKVKNSIGLINKIKELNLLE